MSCFVSYSFCTESGIMYAFEVSCVSVGVCACACVYIYIYCFIYINLEIQQPVFHQHNHQSFVARMQILVFISTG